MTAAAAAETRRNHRPARVMAVPAAAPRSLSREIRDSGRRRMEDGILDTLQVIRIVGYTIRVDECTIRFADAYKQCAPCLPQQLLYRIPQQHLHIQ